MVDMYSALVGAGVSLGCSGLILAAVGGLIYKKTILDVAVRYPAITSGYVLITGTSSGIGADAVLRLASLGFHVFAGVRKQQDGDALIEKAVAQGIDVDRVICVIIDVCKKDTIAAAAALVESHVGQDGLVGLINNAGINVAGPMEFEDIHEIRLQFEVNIFGLLAVTQAFMPMIRRAKGRIINISSMAGFIAIPFQGAYAGSKFALQAISRSMRMELGFDGISVSTINPGFIDTPILTKATQRAQELADHTPAKYKEFYSWKYNEMIMKPINPKFVGPVSLTSDAIADALTSTCPKTVYIIGSKAMLNATKLHFLLPDRFVDYCTMKAYKSRAGTKSKTE